MLSTPETLEKIFREEYGIIVASLIRRTGSFDLAEEALQEAFSAALSRWEVDGLPRNPAAWLTTVAHRKLIDTQRREQTKSEKQSELEYATPQFHYGVELSDDELPDYPDERLRLIFTCCHPSLNLDAQVALTLRTLGGLSTTEIAKAFLLPETTLAQRVVRAKNKIKLARIPYEIPPLDLLPERLDAVRAVVYLIFNEGYAATSGATLIRTDLCTEAIRLGRLLCDLVPDDPENIGLLALMLLQHSRRAARLSESGELVTLEEQDRSRWNNAEIQEGLNLIEKALRLRRPGAYQLQGAIAAVHAEANDSSETDWRQIAALYLELRRINTSAVVALNHAAAVAMFDGAERGLSLVEAAGASGELDNYYLFHASRADLLRRLGRYEEANTAYARALELTSNEVERSYIKKRREEVSKQ
jgi:RNA polymerase sigma-70 factor (ECF subfamily)